MKGFGRWLVGNAALMLFALVLATVAWAVAAEEADPTLVSDFPVSIPIEPVGLAEGLVIVGGLDESVVVTVRAPESIWDSLQAEDFGATIDLSGLDIGTHNLSIDVVLNKRPSVLEYSPERLTIELRPYAAQELPIRPITEGSLAVGYTEVHVEVSPTTAIVSGPASYVTETVEIVAIVQLGNATANIEEDAYLEALDSEGNPVPYVTITPPTVQALVEVEHSVNYKALTVAAPQRTGEVASGYQITGVAIDPPAVTVFGAPDVIAALPSFIEAGSIDTEGAVDDVIVEAELIVPPGVTLLPDQSVKITIFVEPIPGNLTLDIPVEVTGLGVGLVADLSAETVEVFLSGPVPILGNVDESDIRVILDLTGLARGTHLVEPVIEVPEGITVQSIFPSTLQVEIRTTPTPTPGG